MSRKISHSVTLNSVSISNIKEEIFLQPIDQHYQKTKDPYEFEDAAKFFIEYEQRHTINKIINMIAESDFSTDCGSYSTVSKSLDINDEQNFLKAGQKKISFTKIFLVEKWEKNIEEFIMKQNKKIGNYSALQYNSLYGNSIGMNYPERKPRNFFNREIENDFVNDMKLPRGVFTNKQSINAKNYSTIRSPFI